LPLPLLVLVLPVFQPSTPMSQLAPKPIPKGQSAN
jgi:hypothetical protein